MLYFALFVMAAFLSQKMKLTALSLVILSSAVLAQETILIMMYEGQCSGKLLGASSIKTDFIPCVPGGCTAGNEGSGQLRCVSDLPEAAVNKALAAESSEPFWTIVEYADSKCTQPMPILDAMALFPSNRCYSDEISIQATSSGLKMCTGDDCSKGCVEFKQDECKAFNGSYTRASFGDASTKSDAGANGYSPLKFFALALLAFRLL
jgi:hypothetical protein